MLPILEGDLYTLYKCILVGGYQPLFCDQFTLRCLKYLIVECQDVHSLTTHQTNSMTWHMASCECL